MKTIKSFAALAIAGAVMAGGLAVAQSASAAEIPGTITLTPTSGNVSDSNFLTGIAVSVGAPEGYRALSGTFVYQGGTEIGAIAQARRPSMAVTAGANGFDGQPINLNRSIIPTNTYVSNKQLNALSGLQSGAFELRYYFFASDAQPNRATDPYVSLDMTYDATSGAWSVVTAPEPVTVERIAGANRFDTAVGVSQAFQPGVERVYVATGDGYADALSASAAAAHFGVPVLLTRASEVPASVIAEINRLRPAKIVIVGSTASVDAGVETTLKNLSFTHTVSRLGGVNRYDTSRKIAADAFGAGNTDSAYIVTGLNFPDALAASPAAAQFDGPVVLVRGTDASLDTATMSALNTLGVEKVKLAGTSAAVSAGIEAQLDALYDVKRNAGVNRFETSVVINNDAFTEADTAYLATGINFPDALAGGARAGVEDAPLFTVRTNCVPASVLASIEDLGVTKIVLLGGVPSLDANVAALTPCA
ncbi:putative cell wall-binding protein [Leifsonia sp. AK011]|uniref:cell wall-binding repeat-containing protein n=1 Tax=Leifsonia sp. AK011 TaxID=2723075 RepID=UPI0015CC4C67|nr:cell wall-binding repeat-containing protein [Leifsonia sp. AK011]NYF09059.1 putative cell wall-binding protein [Leifsonia sp. AK011]